VLLRDMIERHLKFTGSTRALRILETWDAARTKFVKIFPNEYKRALGEMFSAHAKAAAKKQREAA
jgi:glutamate synthase domain-containing protein 3